MSTWRANAGQRSALYKTSQCQSLTSHDRQVNRIGKNDKPGARTRYAIVAWNSTVSWSQYPLTKRRRPLSEVSLSRIPLAEPYVTRDDALAVVRAIKQRRLSQGDYVNRFEESFAAYIGRKHAIAVSSGTAALHIALAAVGIGQGDEVLVPSFSFIATANCALYQHAKPVFVEIDALTYNVDPSRIESEISEKTKAIIPVHYAGRPADMEPICRLAEKHRIPVIEDAAEALGASFKGKKVGRDGHIACFSFYPNKNMTTGEGGMVVTDDDRLAERMRMIRSQGQDRRYHHVVLGYNYRMTDIQAALGISQLAKLDMVTARKRERARYYSERIKGLLVDEVRTPEVPSDTIHAYIFYSVRFWSTRDRNKAMHLLETRGIQTCIAFPSIHLQPFYRDLFGYRKGMLPVTEEVSDTILSLPIYAHIRRKDQGLVVQSLRDALK